MTEQTFLNMRETMAELQCSRQTVNNLVTRGALKKYMRKIGQGIGGARVRFDAAEIAALKESVTPAAVEIGETERKKRKRK
jgi:predicted DNA-binding transcriptional regulator AlpA